MSLKTRKRIKTPTGLFFTSFEMRERVRSGGPLFQTFIGLFWTGILFDLVRFFCLTRSFSFNYRAIMVGESFKGAPYEDEMFN